MAWCLFCAKPLPEPMMTKITDKFIRHQVAVTQENTSMNTPGPLLLTWVNFKVSLNK